MLAIDQELLRRSWYLQWLRDHYPGFITKSQREVEEFLAAVRPFEEGEPYNGNFIQAKYEGMINALINHSMESGRDVYFTYTPPPGIAPNYFRESVVSAIRLREADGSMTSVNPESLRLRRFVDETITGDRMSEVFKEYYARLILVRAQQSEKFGGAEEALEWYSLAKEFFRNNPQALQQINSAMKRIEKQTPNP